MWTCSRKLGRSRLLVNLYGRQKDDYHRPYYYRCIVMYPTMWVYERFFFFANGRLGVFLSSYMHLAAAAAAAAAVDVTRSDAVVAREGCFDQTWQRRQGRRHCGVRANTCCKRFDGNGFVARLAGIHIIMTVLRSRCIVFYRAWINKSTGGGHPRARARVRTAAYGGSLASSSPSAPVRSPPSCCSPPPCSYEIINNLGDGRMIL